MEVTTLSMGKTCQKWCLHILLNLLTVVATMDILHLTTILLLHLVPMEDTTPLLLPGPTHSIITTITQHPMCHAVVVATQTIPLDNLIMDSLVQEEDTTIAIKQPKNSDLFSELILLS